MQAIADILIIGDDVPSLIAAAVAAKAGARTVLLSIPAAKMPATPSLSDIPNSVWRRLDLQDADIQLEPVSALITLIGEKDCVVTHRSDDETLVALKERSVEAASLWPAFTDEMRAADGVCIATSTKSPCDAFSLLDDLTSLRALVLLSGSAREIIDDYIEQPEIGAHIRAHALADAGLSGTEAGTASALGNFFNEHGWRARAVGGQEKLRDSLRAVCNHHGVEMRSSSISGVAPDGARGNAVLLDDDTKIRCRNLVFASHQAARSAGVISDAGIINAPGVARAVLRIQFRKPVPPPAGDERAVFQLFEDTNSIEAACRDALNGIIPQRPPVGFEYGENGDIIAYTSFIPSRLRDDEGERDWTGQDRQLLSSAMVNSLAGRFEGLRDNIRTKKLSIDLMELPPKQLFAGARNVTVQPHRHDAIAAAVSLVDRILGDE